MYQGWAPEEIKEKGGEASPPGRQPERSLSGTLLSKLSAPPKKVPKFYCGHCFVLLLKCLQKTLAPATVNLPLAHFYLGDNVGFVWGGGFF